MFIDKPQYPMSILRNLCHLILFSCFWALCRMSVFLQNGHVALLNLRVMSPYNRLVAQLAGDGLYVVAVPTGVSKVG